MLPYGYGVSLILAYIPPIWKIVVNPVAIATNKGEKVSAEFLVYQDKVIRYTLICTSAVLSFLCFYIIGFPMTHY